jgi:hypothetical protein
MATKKKKAPKKKKSTVEKSRLSELLTNPTVLDGVFTGGLWKPVSVQEQPSLNVYRWSVREIDGVKAGEKDHHFVGEVDGAGRVSSKIVSFDKETNVGVTRSGRRYKLVGEPGYNSDAEYVWGAWKAINKVVDYTDVSGLYFKP